MTAFRERVLANERLIGTFLGLASPLVAEIVALSGFDWLLVDLEHGCGGEWQALAQLQAVAHTSAHTLVRVESNSRPRVHRALEMGAAGVLIPRIEDVREAELAVSHCRYSGLRGLAKGNRAWEWGAKGDDYISLADEQNVIAMMIETQGALADLDAIAALDGVDVLFMGPADLAQALGVRGGPEHPLLVETAQAIVRAAKKAGKAAGVVVPLPQQTAVYAELGFTFLGCGSDTVMIAREANRVRGELDALRG